jgi:hypothetical protein
MPGIQEVLQTFRSRDQWRVTRYFLGPRKQLEDCRPLDLLRTGQADNVLTDCLSRPLQRGVSASGSVNQLDGLIRAEIVSKRAISVY